MVDTNFCDCTGHTDNPKPLPPVLVSLGETDSVQPVYGGEEGLLLEKSKVGKLNYEFILPDSCDAPVAAGEALGEMVVYSGDSELARVPLITGNEVKKLTIFKLYGKMLSRLYGG